MWWSREFKGEKIRRRRLRNHVTFFIDPVHMEKNRMFAKSIYHALLTALDRPFECHSFFYIVQPDTIHTIDIYIQWKHSPQKLMQQRIDVNVRDCMLLYFFKVQSKWNIKKKNMWTTNFIIMIGQKKQKKEKNDPVLCIYTHTLEQCKGDEGKSNKDYAHTTLH